MKAIATFIIRTFWRPALNLTPSMYYTDWKFPQWKPRTTISHHILYACICPFHNSLHNSIIAPISLDKIYPSLPLTCCTGHSLMADSVSSQCLAQYLEHSKRSIKVELSCLLCYVMSTIFKPSTFKYFRHQEELFLKLFMGSSNVYYQQHSNKCFVIMTIMQNIVCELHCNYFQDP